LTVLRIPLQSGGYAELSLDNAALKAIVAQAGRVGNVTITIEIVDKAKLKVKDRNLVGDAIVFEFIIMAVNKGERITDLQGGELTVTLALSLTSGESNSERTIFYRKSDGEIKRSEHGRYHSRRNQLNNRVVFSFKEI